MCDRKRRVNWRIAHQAAEALRDRGYNTAHAYLCPYAAPGHAHCHVGRNRREDDR